MIDKNSSQSNDDNLSSLLFCFVLYIKKVSGLLLKYEHYMEELQIIINLRNDKLYDNHLM